MADKSLQVQRLAINKQAAQEFVMRPAPQLPPEFVKKFPELEAYDQAWLQWTQDTGNLIRALLSLRLDTGS